VLERTDVVREAWRAGRPLALHGWIYALADGLLRDLGVTVTGLGDPGGPCGAEER
jgi:carbonic anhydrase